LGYIERLHLKNKKRKKGRKGKEGRIKEKIRTESSSSKMVTKENLLISLTL
jgi:hypothetical protein